ncbi:MAG: DMT family transporter [Anaerofustis stercorihominis]|nr:DMT family transporter [Anaerofustis stercorihominis]
MKKISEKVALPQAALFLATIIWGGSFVIMKNAVDCVPPNFLLGIRFTGASILLAVIFRKKLKKINKTYIKGGVKMGTALFWAYCFQTWGLLTTTPGKNAFLTAIYCVTVPFLSWFVTRKRPDIYNFTAAFVGIIGIGFVSLDSSLTMEKGDILTLIGGFFFAVHMICTSQATKTDDSDPVVLTIIQFATAAVFSWGMSFVLGEQPVAFEFSTVLGIMYLICFATATTLLLQSYGQKYTDPASASLILSLESVFGVIFSVIFYKEKLNALMVTGFMLIFIAIVISETKLSFLRRNTEVAENIGD